MNLNSILIGSSDPQRLVAYYTKLFGAPSFRDEGYSGWQLGDGSIFIGHHDQVAGPNAHPGRIIWNLESGDVKSDFDRLVERGAIVVREPYGFEGIEGWIATFADPDENYFQLMSPMGPDPDSEVDALT